MTWRVIIPTDFQQRIWDLPPGPRSALHDFVAERLRIDPHAATSPYGQDPGGPVQVRTAAVGPLITAWIVSAKSGDITLVELVHAG
ncbi:hypothetical protein [Streptomyces jumonjinensis]|uniref:Cytotoxic translational repressor of toxin-antitoxin stability system n=1 Tax=Streptomyces jumonjinensis TaxID=1945 RepID=A0A646KLF1_STRJU|nr:hypothetical protein [Streptomyces jumonjinensis]MQT03144.1 hypothetical protein [Streptomyces jumonjinensis]